MEGGTAILRTVMGYANLKTAVGVLGPHHPDVLDRAAKIVARCMRNFSGMAHVFRRVLTQEYDVPVEGVPLRTKSWFWPRNYFFNYPEEFVHTWHMPTSSWKRMLMLQYCPVHQMSRPVSRYELFCIQKEMREEDIINMGW